MTDRGDQPKYPIESVGNALVALDLLRREPSVRIVDLAEKVGVARSTAHRLMTSLMAHGFAEPGGGGQSYRAGDALLRLGSLALERLEVRRVAHPVLEGLASETGETSELAVLDRSEVIVVDVVEGRHRLRVVDPVGSRAPAHLTAVGRAMLAFIETPSLEERFGVGGLEVRTPRSVATLAELDHELGLIRAEGYAEVSMELGDDYVGVAAPVLSRSGLVVAGVTLAVPAMRATPGFAAALGPVVAAAAQSIGGRLSTESVG